jgi:peptidoglycan-N-acetylglucosamine deacetylase
MRAETTLVTSWDDGHPADLRLAERLTNLGIAATFFVPVRNIEGRPVMKPADWRSLEAAGFEIAAHTLDHVRLSGLPLSEARRQLIEGRLRLEDALGHAVAGFAYPGGKMGRHARRLVREAGFAYARTTRMWCLDPGADILAMSTTAQFYPHGSGAMARNWLRQGAGLHRLALGCRWLTSDTLEARISAMADAAELSPGSVLHLWGHGWELEELELWSSLTRVMAMLAERIPVDRRLTVGALAARQSAIGKAAAGLAGRDGAATS